MNLKPLNLTEDDFTCCCRSEKYVRLRWKIKGFSQIVKNGTALSPAFKFLKVDWNIVLQLKDGSAGKESVSLYIQCPKIADKNKFSIRLVFKNNKGGVFKTYALENETLKEGQMYGLMDFVDRWDFLNGKLGKVKLSDSFMVHCEICTLDATVKVQKVNSSPAGGLIEDLRALLESGKHSDVVLKIADVELPAHKCILSLRSDVFRAMFDSDMRENNLSVVDLVEMSPDVAKIMLRYIYTDKLEELNKKNMLELYAAAEKYFLLTMKTICRNYIPDNLTVDNVCDVALFADLHSDDLLKEATDEFLSLNIKSVLETEAWRTLSESNPQIFLHFISRSILIHPCIL